MTSLRGVCAAVLTPLDAAFRPDAAKAIPYYGKLLERGCDALNVLGTTGEAMSLPLADRLAYMEAIAGSALPRERMMVGTGAASLADAAALTSAAMRLGFGAALVMPPFFFRGMQDEGVLRFFEELFDEVKPREGAVFLYHYPAMSGIAFHPELVERLMRAFPGVIGGIKDSANDPQLQRDLASAHPDLLVYPSSEASLSAARESGYAGCISGTVALWPQLAAQVWRGDAAAQERLTALRQAAASLPLIPAVRYLTSRGEADAQWERCVPPLSPLSEEQARALDATLEGVGV